MKIFTPEWWDAVHAALKTATELDMEIGMFNSPGWSQSGGPWVKPEQSMRYLAATDTMVKGPRTLSYTIPEYSDSMQLVRVIAYPTQSDVFKKEWKLQQKGYEPVVLKCTLMNHSLFAVLLLQQTIMYGPKRNCKLKSVMPIKRSGSLR